MSVQFTDYTGHAGTNFTGAKKYGDLKDANAEQGQALSGFITGQKADKAKMYKTENHNSITGKTEEMDWSDNATWIGQINAHLSASEKISYSDINLEL